jgi:hypothetical protein
MANGKKILWKLIPDTPSPATNLLYIFWGAWLDFILYYAGKLEIFCPVVNELDRVNAPPIAVLQEILNGTNLLKVLKSSMVYNHVN